MTKPITSTTQKPLDIESQTSSSSEMEEKTEQIRKRSLKMMFSENRNKLFLAACLVIACCPIVGVFAACFGCFKLSETFAPQCCEAALEVGPIIADATVPAAEGCGTLCMGCFACIGALGECLDD